MFKAIGDFLHYIATGEEDGGRKPAPENSTETPPQRGFFGALKRVVKVAYWIVEEVAHVLNEVIKVVTLTTSVKSSAASLLSGEPKLVLVS